MASVLELMNCSAPEVNVKGPNFSKANVVFILPPWILPRKQSLAPGLSSVKASM